MIGYIYILKDDRGSLYIGSTSDLNRRLSQHIRGYTQTTKKMKNLKIIFKQKFSTLVQARKAERKLKRLKRKDYLEK